jgi:hypothetical protein
LKEQKRPTTDPIPEIDSKKIPEHPVGPTKEIVRIFKKLFSNKNRN